jgi:release factor glutamine methyltransferase
LDIGTGSGVLGISILLQNPDTFKKVCLSDISPEALEVAKRNYDTLIPHPEKYDTYFLQANLLSFFQERFASGEGGHLINSKSLLEHEGTNILVANLPYIPDETFDNNALENVQKREPRLAFVGGNDGLDYYRELFHQLKSI